MAEVIRIVVKRGEMFGGAGLATMTPYRKTQESLDLNNLPFDPAEVACKTSLAQNSVGTVDQGVQGAFSCALVESENYRETLWLRAIPALSNSFELSIQTQLLSSKPPEESRAKARVCIDLEHLRQLHRSIGKFLGEA